MSDPHFDSHGSTERFAAMSQRLADLEARMRIRELVSTYCMACDDRDLDRLCELYTPEGVFRTCDGAIDARGRDAIRSYFVGSYPDKGPTYHWTHDHLVTIDPSGESASGVVFGHAEASVCGVGQISAMRYHDQYVRQDGVWRFRERLLTFLYYAPMSDWATILSQSNRIVRAGRAGPADYPETLSTWAVRSGMLAGEPGLDSSLAINSGGAMS